METSKILNCMKCDAEMEMGTPVADGQVICRRCGCIYRLLFNTEQQAWILQEQEALDAESEAHQKEEPFSVLSEVGRPKKVDRSEVHREQTDIHEDEDIAIDKEHRKP